MTDGEIYIIIIKDIAFARVAIRRRGRYPPVCLSARGSSREGEVDEILQWKIALTCRIARAKRARERQIFRLPSGFFEKILKHCKFIIDLIQA